MLRRYLYILICLFDVCFCYNFIDNYGKYVKKHIGNRRNKIRDNHVQFDLTEFIRADKKDAEIDDNLGHVQNNYNYMGLSNDNIRPTDDSEYLNDMKDNEIELNNNLKDLLSLEESNAAYDVTENLVDDPSDSLVENVIHNPEKKCAFKKMKIPFFSHSTSTTKSRNTIKMKILGKEYPKTGNPEELPDLGITTKKALVSHNINENRHGKRFSNKYKKLANKRLKMIHNSRQFFENKAYADSKETSSLYQHKTTLQLSRYRKETPEFDYRNFILEDILPNFHGFDIDDDRVKRNDNDERDRRLKELEKLEKKVDNVQIQRPVITKPTGEQTH